MKIIYEFECQACADAHASSPTPCGRGPKYLDFRQDFEEYIQQTK